jgi:hypothetical protein
MVLRAVAKALEMLRSFSMALAALAEFSSSFLHF